MAGLDSDVKLLLHFDGVAGSTNIIDSSVVGHTVTAVADTAISTTESKFGGASVYQDFFGDKLTIPDSTDWDFMASNTNPFTIDFWVKFDNDTDGNRGFVSQVTNQTNGWGFYLANGNLEFYARGSFQNHLWNAPWAPVADEWYHVACVRDSSENHYLFVNGVGLTVDLISKQNARPKLYEPLQLGYWSFSGNWYFSEHWMDEFRLSHVARWTEDFTPPTEAYSAPSIQIGVSPIALTFGDVDVNTTSDLEATITATGELDLTVSGLTVDNNFYTIIDSPALPFTLSTLGSTTATIRYSPILAQTDTGSFDITNDSPWTPIVNVPLYGVGIAAPEIGITPMTLGYGNVEITTTSDLTTTISNTGSDTLIVSGMTVDNNMYTIINPISVPFNIAISGSTVATVRFSPESVGSEPGTFTVTSDDAMNPVLGLTLSGTGFDDPEINVTSLALTFGDVEITTTYDLDTTIQNTGTGDLTVSGLTVDNNFYTIINPISVPFVIAPAGSTVATIRYSPITAGNDTGSFDITSDDTDEPTTYVTLDGNAVEYPDINATPMTLGYGNVDVGNTSDLTTTISNIGTGNLTVSGITVDNDVYTIISPISVPFTIASAGSTVSTIRFTPTEGATESGTFSITSDDAINSVIGLTLSGLGIVNPEINVSPTSLNYGNVDAAQTSDLTTTISNLGTGILTVSGMTVGDNLFTIISPISVPFYIPVSGSTVANIRYSPVVAGTVASDFTITSDDADESAVVVTLNGTSIATISESTINFNLYIDKARDFTSYIDQARDFTSYIDQARNFDLEL